MSFSVPADAGPSVLIEHDHPTLHVDGPTLRTLIHRIAEVEGRALGTVSIVLTDHDTVLALNRDYLGHDYVTDVLSFDLSAEDASHVEGEIYVDLDTAAERHEDFGVSFEDEARRYVVHGMLHLMGYDDSDDSQQAEMRRLEDWFLATVH